MNRAQALLAIAQLKRKDLPDEHRRRLQRELSSGASEVEVELCDELARGTESGVIIDIINIMGASQREAFFQPLSNALHEGQDEAVAQVVATNIGKLESQNSLTILVGLLRHKSPNVRYGAIRGLAALSDKRAVKHLREILDDDGEARCWWAGSKAGGYIVSREAAIAIDEICGEKFRGDRSKIEQWLSQHND